MQSTTTQLIHFYLYRTNSHPKANCYFFFCYYYKLKALHYFCVPLWTSTLPLPPLWPTNCRSTILRGIVFLCWERKKKPHKQNKTVDSPWHVQLRTSSTPVFSDNIFSSSCAFLLRSQRFSSCKNSVQPCRSRSVPLTLTEAHCSCIQQHFPPPPSSGNFFQRSCGYVDDFLPLFGEE